MLWWIKVRSLDWPNSLSACSWFRNPSEHGDRVSKTLQYASERGQLPQHMTDALSQLLVSACGSLPGMELSHSSRSSHSARCELVAWLGVRSSGPAGVVQMIGQSCTIANALGASWRRLWQCDAAPVLPRPKQLEGPGRSGVAPFARHAALSRVARLAGVGRWGCAHFVRFGGGLGHHVLRGRGLLGNKFPL